MNVTDEAVAEQRRHFSEPEIVELSMTAAVVAGVSPIDVARNVAPDTEEFQVFDFADPKV